MVYTMRVRTCMLNRMKEISNIHAFEDERFLHACITWGLIVVVLFAACAVPLFMLVGGPADLDAALDSGLAAVFCWVIGAVVVSCASFAVHELVHALFFKLFAPAGARVTFGAHLETAMIYACAEGIVYSRFQYLVVCLAPTVALTIFFVLGGVFAGLPLLCYLACGVHLSGCTGGWYYVWTILHHRHILACKDTAYGVSFFGADESDGPDGFRRRANDDAAADDEGGERP